MRIFGNCSARGFFAVSCFMSTKPTQRYLNGVFIEPPQDKPGVNIVATDGHTLGIYYDEKGHISEPAILQPSKGVINACKRKDPSRALRTPVDDELRVIIDEDTIEIGKHFEKIGDGRDTSFINGTFPDWRRVIPKRPNKPTEFAAFNAAHLGKFAKLFGRKPQAIRIETGSKNDPAFVVLGDEPRFTGVIMPLFWIEPTIS